MRILQVIHQFPPYSSQGSEVYCLNLSRELNQRNELRVFHISNAPGHWRRSLRREEHLGITTYHCVDRAEYSRLADWRNAYLQASFNAVLKDFSPDIVHFHNYLSLGDDLVSMARSSGAVVVYTLHDFGLICPNTFLLRTDGRLCLKETPDFFEDCCPAYVRTTGTRVRPWIGARLPSLTRWRAFGEQQPKRWLRTAILSCVRGAEILWGGPKATDIAQKRDFFFTHTRRIFDDAALFLAPSQFLRGRYVNCGIPAHKIRYLRNGMRFLKTRQQSAVGVDVRFGYIGALHPQKGIELLLKAFRELGGNASLHIHGSAFMSPISRNYSRRLLEHRIRNVVFHGAYDNERVHEVLESIDVVVVPSLWYENSPLTIQEAFAAGVPVITAGCGGMAEQVRNGFDGLHFKHGDAEDLRRTMLQVVENPELLKTLRNNIPDVPRIEHHAKEMSLIYRSLCSEQ